MGRLLLAITVLSLALVWTAPANACGSYRLTTPEGHVAFEHGFVRDSEAGVVLSIASAQRWAALGRVDRPDRVERTEALRFTGDRVVLGTAVRARIEGDAVHVGARTFRLAISTGEAGTSIAVTEGEAAVLTGSAPETACSDDVRMRVVLYLAWRYGPT